MTEIDKKDIQALYMRGKSIKAISIELKLKYADVRDYIMDNKIDELRNIERDKMAESERLPMPNINKHDMKKLNDRNNDMVRRISVIEDMMSGKLPIEEGKELNDLVLERNQLFIKMQSFLNTIFDNGRSANSGKKDTFNIVLGR